MTNALHPTPDPPPSSPEPFQIMAKPVGPACNLDCSYCFYLEKKNLFPKNEQYRMSDEVLERFIREYIAAQDVPAVDFAWQGGEPTLLGVKFFKKVVQLQREYAGGKVIRNAIQTNGVLLNDAWGEFLSENHFLVGISIDGPRNLHDTYRVDRRGRPTFDRVMQGLECLKKHNVEFNILTVVHRKNSKDPLRVYLFLKDIGCQFIQFIPLVERRADSKAKALGLPLAVPPEPGEDGEPASAVTAWSVQPKQYGIFLSRIFEEWVRKDVGQVFVYLFEYALASWSGSWVSLCVFQERCGKAIVFEHNGDLFSCDHYVYPAHRIGNILEDSLESMVNSRQQIKFGADKLDTLPNYCRQCDVRFACNGECPKHRFLKTPDGENGLNYLCEGYQHYFRAIDPYMRTMAQLLREGRPPALIKDMLARTERSRRTGN